MISVNGVSNLNTILSGVSSGVQTFTVASGAQGDSNATAIVLGDMTRIPCGAYVVSHWNGALSGGGISDAVAQAGGQEGMNTYKRFLASLPRQEGEDRPHQNWADVHITPSGGGLSTHLLHAVTLNNHANRVQEMEIVRTATTNALEMANQQGLNFVVFPALGTGISGHLPHVLAAVTLLGAIQLYRDKSPEALPHMIAVAIREDHEAYDTWVRGLATAAVYARGVHILVKIVEEGTMSAAEGLQLLKDLKRG